MTTTRFVVAPKSDVEAINQVADRAIQVGQCGYTSQATAPGTLGVAAFINGLYSQTGTPGAVNLTTPTAAAIVAAIKNCQVGDAFDFQILNNGDATITVVAGSGVTLVGTTAVPTVKGQIYKGIVTVATVGSEAVTLVAVLKAPI